jgi:hypothetical protein
VSIVDKRGALRQTAVVPVFCDGCGMTSELPRATDRMRDALIHMGYYREFFHELELLERTELLFARFPESRHPLVAEHLHIRPSEVATSADEEFERALGVDAELHEFLGRCGFLLPARLQFVRESVASYSARLHEFRVHCQTCEAGTLCLEQEFFERLG